MNMRQPSSLAESLRSDKVARLQSATLLSGHDDKMLEATRPDVWFKHQFILLSDGRKLYN